MRRIKFRGKRIDNGQWVYGSLAHVHDTEGNESIIPFSGNYFVSIKNETVCQFTGLFDRNGKEVYEHDIVQGEFAKYVVFWDEKMSQSKIRVIETKSVLSKHCQFPLWQYVEKGLQCRFEVIGNEFENIDPTESA